MSLPANENTTSAYDAYVIREYGPAKHIKVPNSSGGAWAQGALVKAGPFVGVVDYDIASGAGGTISVDCGIRVGASRTGAGQTFADFGQAVYFDVDDRKLYETDDGTRYLIGYVAVVADSAGVVEVYLFDTVRYSAAAGASS